MENNKRERMTQATKRGWFKQILGGWLGRRASALKLTIWLCMNHFWFLGVVRTTAGFSQQVAA
jgi:hypothetical protein